jgi:hypothetical protein
MQGRLAVECDGEHWHGPERYEHDMARQRDLERAGWRFVRIRGGDFYRDRERSLEPLWAELTRLGIKPGGLDAAAAEPPPPETEDPAVGVGSDRDDEDLVEVELSTPRSSTPADDPVDEGGDSAGPDEQDSRSCSSASETPLLPSEYTQYAEYSGMAGGDPRIVSLGEVADGLCRIIEVEGPVIARRAYATYLRACGIKRMGAEVKSTMNKALSSAIRHGKVVSTNEPGVKGVIDSTVRIAGASAVRIRTRGPRDLKEIPPDELRAVGRRIASDLGIESGTDEHLRLVLAHFDLKRLTAQVAASISAILAQSGPDADKSEKRPDSVQAV